MGNLYNEGSLGIMPREGVLISLIIWNLAGVVFLFSSLVLLLSFLWERKPAQVNLRFDGSDSSDEERGCS